jgi:hypothetical protein
MVHEIAKLLLEHADTFIERTEAVRSALKLGMPLHEIETYLDWLDMMRAESDTKGGGDATSEEDPSSP